MLLRNTIISKDWSMQRHCTITRERKDLAFPLAEQSSSKRTLKVQAYSVGTQTMIGKNEAPRKPERISSIDSSFRQEDTNQFPHLEKSKSTMNGSLPIALVDDKDPTLNLADKNQQENLDLRKALAEANARIFLLENKIQRLTIEEKGCSHQNTTSIHGLRNTMGNGEFLRPGKQLRRRNPGRRQTGKPIDSASE